MNKLEIDLKGYPACRGNESPSIIIDGNQLDDVAGFEITSKVGEFARAIFDIYVRDLKASADAGITINANAVTDDIGFSALESLLQYFLNNDDWREKTEALLTHYIKQ